MIAKRLRRQSKEQLVGKPLTKRERETVRYLSLGMDHKQIAAKMHISTSTVRNYICTAKTKTGIRSKTLLSFYAYSKGYVTKDDIKREIIKQKREEMAVHQKERETEIIALAY